MNEDEKLNLLNRFIDLNYYIIKSPFNQKLPMGDFLCATNSKKLILIPNTNPEIIFTTSEKLPDINGIVPEFKDNIVVNVDELIQNYLNIPIIERFITEECESCDGFGKFQHYENEYECITCAGTGKIETTNTEKIKNPKILFKFKDFYLSNEYILDVINIIDSVKPVTTTIVSLSSSIWFKFDDVYAVFTGFNALTQNINDYKIITIEE